MTLEQLKKLCDEATPGPWAKMESWAEGCVTLDILGDNAISSSNADFLIAARTYMPVLLEIAEYADNFVSVSHDRVFSQLKANEQHWRDKIQLALNKLEALNGVEL